VDIYKNASTIGGTLTTPLAEVYFCGYDAKSDLYCDGFTSATAVGLVELPHGTTTWVTLSGVSIEYPGGVQWDGKYITINDQEAHDIRGYTCSSGNCTLERTVVLKGAGDCVQTWIANGYVICPDVAHNEGAIYKYPAGGHAIAHLAASSGFSEPLGSVQAVK
jgi:hypothetical protein